ncbi:MAG: hypothetical protein HYZ26_02290 [Chloroflexi bacterium]|nr:hypothetical protein [Chloroflexota bacterium]
MDRRTAGIVAIIFTLILCACPGIGLAFFAGLDSLSYLLPIEEPPIFQPLELVLLACIGLALMLIPLGVWLYYFAPRRKPKIKYDDEPLPPAI